MTGLDISYDILWLILKYVNFWLLQGHLSKILGLHKINFFSMKEQQSFDEAGGGLGGQVPRLFGGIIFSGVWHTWGGGLAGHRKQRLHFLTHLQHLRGSLALTYLIQNQSIGVD